MWPFGKKTKERVEEAFKANKQLGSLGLSVQEKGGQVKLTGVVPSQQHANLAQLVAQGVNDVKSVDISGIKVNAPAPAEKEKVEAEAKEIETSSKIAKEVLSVIRGNAELQDDPIDVLQSGSSVILRGVVDSDHEKNLAEKLAREVSGVAGVDVSGLRVHENAKALASQKDEAGETVYTVQAGDTLSKIAQKYYGDLQAFDKIAKYNGISNPDHIEVGQQIRIPG